MTRGQRLFVTLTAFFIACLFLAELTGSKLFQVDVPDFSFFGLFRIEAFTMTLGVIPFPITFVITDLMNEYFGRRGVRFVTLLGMLTLVLAYGLILLDIHIPAASISPVTDEAFHQVFANSNAIIVASMVAYLIGQLIDIQVFHFLRRRTGHRHIWLRATGSTVVSQLIDSFVVIYIAFGTTLSTQHLPLGDIGTIATTNFLYKLIVAVLITPVIYLGHAMIDRHLGPEAHVLQDRAQRDESFVITTYPA